ncbi:hypothetical protein QCA50_011818 [Cerrena zonata]|uniref:Uncharacterized protein n=1 Tax=Cerrena zonata TaxID=2478898 RepID=A0AAW0FTN1_9APHY
MSLSPPLRRLSSTSSSSKESLINAYEAEEERIINVLSRKLERIREEKIELENALEAESEAAVNRLSREISALRLAQQTQSSSAQVNGNGSISPIDVRGRMYPVEPAPEVMLDAMRRENEDLRARLTDAERNYIHVTRLNDIYREELIEHRRRLGLPVDNLIGLASPLERDPYSQPLHLHSQSNASSASISPYHPLPQSSTTHASSARVPIPRPPSQIHRPVVPSSPSSPSTTPPSSTPASHSSALFSPAVHSTSAVTNITTPGSGSEPQAGFVNGDGNPHALTYPSVPPPSLSSSFGDPSLVAEDNRSRPLPAPVPIPRAIPRRDRDLSISPTDSFGGSRLYSGAPSSPLSPRRSSILNHRGSFERTNSGMNGGHLMLNESPGGRTGGGWVDGFETYGGTRSRSRSRVRGVRVAETGRLVPRSRRQSTVENGAEVEPSNTAVTNGVNGTHH